MIIAIKTKDKPRGTEISMLGIQHKQRGEVNETWFDLRAIVGQ
jgi:hypothetical protein